MKPVDKILTGVAKEISEIKVIKYPRLNKIEEYTEKSILLMTEEELKKYLNYGK